MSGTEQGKTGSGLARLVAVIALGASLAGCLDDDNRQTLRSAAHNLLNGDGGGNGTVSPPTNPTTNRAPTISGTPVTTAKVSVPYSFQPRASDPDGDRLTFEIRSKPDWATFSSSTGRLEGTPPAGSTGTFTGVQIIVSDGSSSTALNPFSISVVEPTVGSAELVWDPPMSNVDGSPLTDLAGYVIRYGRSATALDRSIRIDNPGTSVYVVDNLVEGTWYFSLSAVNAAGEESRPTGYVTTTIG